MTPFDVPVPEGRLFPFGDHSADADDACFFLDRGQSGTVPRSAVEARAPGTPARPVPFGLAPLAGGLTSLAGGGALAASLKGRPRPGAVSVVGEAEGL
ncbi:hypothetical protein I3F58_15715 [Streptomyces sp. MUM 203J]|uniref:S26 family signal peptidase n=1 Tax=Streptomyces sp. MUM 203J TaxID=2791990 RepID=UPI001F043975|nr:S26 family signal peptidase [Streptomyces sp. MUM 203J]MCH0540991.1 hypothetical protein [Streptomyces sp. MUM 203J]